MDPRFAQFPKALADRARPVTLGPNQVPALLAHPDWATPAPAVIWMHGRTASKEIDPGRYLRWIRAGIAACALDLPGHGDRADPRLQTPAHTLDVLGQMLRELDSVVLALAEPPYAGIFDARRLAIGGMSAGGMVALRRLCDPHPFVCASVECTTGWLTGLYFPQHADAATRASWAVAHAKDAVERLDPAANLALWRCIPVQAQHNLLDDIIPIAGQRHFLDRLRRHYQSEGGDPAQIEFREWPQSGAPHEHSGFGRFSNDAKNAQVEFLTRMLNPVPETRA